MFDLPVLVELLQYLNDKDAFNLASVNRQIKEDILMLRKERCDDCKENRDFCLKKLCQRNKGVYGILNMCTKYTCSNRAITYNEVIMKGHKDQMVISKRIVCHHCNIFQSPRHNHVFQLLCDHYTFCNKCRKLEKCTKCRSCRTPLCLKCYYGIKACVECDKKFDFLLA